MIVCTMLLNEVINSENSLGSEMLINDIINCLLIMSSIGLSGISGISENTLQTRYEKALKQINKLIEINRQLK